MVSNCIVRSPRVETAASRVSKVLTLRIWAIPMPGQGHQETSPFIYFIYLHNACGSQDFTEYMQKSFPAIEKTSIAIDIERVNLIKFDNII